MSPASPIKVAVAIGVRYSNWRLQFSPSPSEPEVSLMFYQTQRRRILQPMAVTLAFDFFYIWAWDQQETYSEIDLEVHHSFHFEWN